MRFQISHPPTRALTGAYILNSGVTKLKLSDAETHKHLHAMACNAYPQFEQLDPGLFTRILGVGEMVLGTALAQGCLDTDSVAVMLKREEKERLRDELVHPERPVSDSDREFVAQAGGPARGEARGVDPQLLPFVGDVRLLVFAQEDG